MIMRKQIDWSKINAVDSELVLKIVERAAILIPDVNRGSLQMDIIATHVSGCRIKLQKLLDAKSFDFYHDVCGIMQHINRTTGKLQNCFLPRYAC